MVKVKVVNNGRQPLPEYATSQSAGLDLRANIESPITLKPLERRLIPTGLRIALPEGYEAQGAAAQRACTGNMASRCSTHRERSMLTIVAN